MTIAFLVLSSCGSEDKNLEQYLVDVSKFKIDNAALKDGEEIRILGASGNLTNDDEMDFYNLVVVESLETGKVVNVLMLDYIFVDENNRDLNFISFETQTGKMYALNASDAFEPNANIDDIEIPTFDKVLYDTEYIQDDIYGNPTVIGGLAKVYKASPENFINDGEVNQDAIKKVIDSNHPNVH